MSKDLFQTAPTIVDSSRILYTASSFARSSLLHLQECGSLTALAPHTSSRSGLPSYLFFIVESGTGSLSYNNNTYRLFAGDCVFIDCKEAYSHSTQDDLWSLKWVHFYGPTMSGVYNKYLERGGRPVFRPESAAAFFEIFDIIYTTASSSDYMRDMLLNEQLAKLVRMVMAESWHPEDKKSAPKRQSVLQVKEYIDKQYAEKITLEELASTFFIDKYYLAKSFKEQFGLTISSYLQTIRITHAKKLLRFSEKSIEQIAASVGISDPAYFSRLFRRVEGVSPSEYREKW